MSELSIANVINVSVSQAPAGIGAYNTSNVGLFTVDVPGESFGSDPYKIYRGASGVLEDWGSTSKVYAMARALFSQKPNILQGGGYLTVIPLVVEVQTITPDGVPASGTFKLNFGGDQTAALNWNDNAATIQTAVRTLTGLEAATVTGTIAGGLTVTFKGYYGNAALITVSDSSLATSAPAAVTLTVAQTTAGEQLDEAILRTKGLIQYFGVMASLILESSDMLDSAGYIQTLNKIGFFVQRDDATVEEDGALDMLRQGSYDQSRGLYYGADNDEDALEFQAAYAGRALSTNFSGSRTTQTMHLKDLTGIVADDSLDETLLGKCQDAGVDVYASIQGVAKVFTSGANNFFDRVYNRQWFVGAIEVAGFNALAETSSKIAQTEEDMDILKGGYRSVCQQAVRNRYCAPGTWNSPDTFGVQEDFYNNISEQGFYIYTTPINQQSQEDRDDRIAPLAQIALKEAGAVHSGAVIININP